MALNHKMPNKGGVYSKPDMIRALVAHLRSQGCLATSNAAFGSFQFDVLAFNKQKFTLMGFECMYGGQPSTLAARFALAYSHLAGVQALGLDLSALRRARDKKGTEWPDLTTAKLDVRFSVSVVLMDKVCRRVELLRSLKSQFPPIGVMRVKLNGECRDYVRDRHGNTDLSLTTGTSVTIPAGRPKNDSEQKANMIGSLAMESRHATQRYRRS